MYGDTGVNEELRDRLPRAHTGDARKQLEEEIEQLKQKESALYT